MPETIFRHVSSLHKELASVRVLASIRHRQQERLVVLQRQVLVVEYSTIDTFAAGSIPVCEITRLHHKVFDDAVKDDTLKRVQTLKFNESTSVALKLMKMGKRQLPCNINASRKRSPFPFHQYIELESSRTSSGISRYTVQTQSVRSTSLKARHQNSSGSGRRSSSKYK